MNEFPGVRTFVQKLKLAVMNAHDNIIASRVKQIRSANRKWQKEPFVVGDLVYISGKNISVPKGLARKLVPKYLGPYRILKDFSNHFFQVDIPVSFKAR
ncbi:hypothetical protein AMATHDRAFT_155455 [Amanita thiersii Skay4041]|uniref:Tf2-1-like SH3-like domain-containing protein n=1 Tax=Amanita thiersii Skay4041 TaxID=703135 RepID=A0A2A9NDM0_9AGAR|nr:hypothetical protein AMATHDRAFT_155455 [Amanita thiersii Skay4041]